MRDNNNKKDDGDLSAWVVVWLVLTALYFLFAVGVVIYLFCYADILNLITAKDTTTDKVEIITKLGTLFFAIIGFPMIFIRNIISEGQRREAFKQGERAQKQLEETERNNIAKLLIDATKMLGAGTTDAERIAAIACLDNIMQGSSSFSKQAAEVVYNFIRSEGVEIGEEGTKKIKIEDSVIEKAFFVLAEYSNKNREKFPFFGFKVAHIHFENNASLPLYFVGMEYEDCHFFQSEFNFLHTRFRNCQFRYCVIDEFNFLSVENYFVACIFVGNSNFVFSYFSPNINNTDAEQEQFTDCYYLEGLEPSDFAGYDFSPMSLETYREVFSWNLKK